MHFHSLQVLAKFFLFFQLLALAGIRKAMECIFSLHDLSWLDDILPQEFVGEEGQKSEEIDSTDSEDVRYNLFSLYRLFFTSQQ